MTTEPTKALDIAALRALLEKIDLPVIEKVDGLGYGRVYQAPEEPHFVTGDLLAEVYGDGDGLVAAAINALPALLSRIEELEEGLRRIADWQPKPFDFPADWREQIDACAECKQYSGHPIQQGICDTHRRPLWNREKHDRNQEAVRGYQCQSIARDVLAALLTDRNPS